MTIHRFMQNPKKQPHHIRHNVSDAFIFLSRLTAINCNFTVSIVAFMPPSSGGPNAANPFLPYPTSSNNFMPYPPNSFGNFPTPYPPATSSNNPSGGAGYPPYIPPGSPGYNNMYGSVRITIRNINVFPSNDFKSFHLQNNNPSNDGTTTITEEHIKASLVSAVEDKFRRRIQERVNQYQAEMETLNRTKQELLDGRNKINDIVSKLEREEVCQWFRFCGRNC